MKKILILLTAFLFTYKLSNAQTEKGTQNLGLSLGFSSNNSDNFVINPGDNSTSTLSTKTSSFNIGPNYGYFIADRLELGGSLSYSTTTSKNNTDPLKETVDNFGASLFIRKYFMYKNVVGFRTGGYLGYTNANQTQTWSSVNTKYNFDGTTNYYSAGANLDLVFYPSKRLGFSATIANLEYYHYKNNNGSQGNGSGDNVSFSLINNGLSLSVFYVFGK